MNNKERIAWILGFNGALLVILIYLLLFFEFENSGWIILLVIVPPLSVYFIWKREDYFGGLRLADTSELKTSKFLQLLPKWIKLSSLIALFFSIVAFARPLQEMMPKDISKEGIDIIIALDVSMSMLAMDFEPNRLEASKRVAKEFVMNRVNDRIGIVTYAAESFPRVPLTSDNAMVINAIDKIKYGELVDGTAIGMGLASSVNRLKESDSKSKAVILLSDGVSNRGRIKPHVASELAKAYGVTVYTIGVGSEGTALSPTHDFYGNVQYQEIPVEIDEKTLFEIAENTGGKYFRATSEQKLKDIYIEIDKLEKTRFEATIIKQKADIYWKFLVVALVILCASFVLKKVIFKSVYS